MLPPIDTVVLSSNPRFGFLYKDLTTNKLDAHGATKLDGKAQLDRDALTNELREARIEAARRNLIKRYLEDLSYHGDQLPDELQEVVAVAAASLDGSISTLDRELIQRDVAIFKVNGSLISQVLASRVQQDADVLAKVLNPSNPPLATQMPRQVESIKHSIETTCTSIGHARLALATKATELRNLQTQMIEISIRILEQTIHGSVARGAKAKADYLSQVAEGMDKKLSLQLAQLQNQLYSAEFQECLQLKVAQQKAKMQVTLRRVRDAEAKLEQYRASEQATSMAAEYTEILRETARVKADLTRLQRE